MLPAPGVDSHSHRSPPAAALSHVPSHLRFWIVAVGAVAADLLSKRWAFATLRPDEERPLIGGWLLLRRSLNDGAVFGSFSGYVELFLAASLFALGFVFYLFARSAPSQRITHVALALVLAGALGNLYDRAFMKADVVRTNRAGGLETTMIGTLVNTEGEDKVRVGDWPEGTRPRSYPSDEVVVTRQGVVRDFIKFTPSFPAWLPRVGGRDIWPWVFNIADSALVCGVCVLLFASWLERKPGESEDATA
ncbi:MAG: signal peptidase II [Planctomycetes bacterium]|nr:signal peptidase II [Planctomycetota bacterium]